MKALALLLALLAAPVWAVEPGEMLADPTLEARARDISAGLRCPVCRNESIDESHADLARDIRVMVRERLVAGDSDAAVTAAVVARYGEYALLMPDTRGSNVILWVAGPAMLVFALAIALAAHRRRRMLDPSPPLSAEDEARVRDILQS